MKIWGLRHEIFVGIKVQFLNHEKDSKCENETREKLQPDVLHVDAARTDGVALGDRANHSVEEAISRMAGSANAPIARQRQSQFLLQPNLRKGLQVGTRPDREAAGMGILGFCPYQNDRVRHQTNRHARNSTDSEDLCEKRENIPGK